MVPAALRRLGTLGLIALWVLVSGGLLLLLALSVQNSVQYSKMQAWILLINAIAVVTVSVLLARKIIELVRAFRAQVPGSRLTARTVLIVGHNPGLEDLVSRFSGDHCHLVTAALVELAVPIDRWSELDLTVTASMASSWQPGD